MRRETIARPIGAIGIVLIVLASSWAAPLSGGSAHYFARESAQSAARGETDSKDGAESKPNRVTRGTKRATVARTLPTTATFRYSSSRGLLVDVWINSAGPYTFAIDTGAGSTIVTNRVAREAGIGIKRGGGVTVSGLTGAGAISGREGRIDRLAVGSRENRLPSSSECIVVGNLGGIDGLLDPTEGYAPLGFIIDMSNEEIRAFDPRVSPLRSGDLPQDGAVVPWVFRDGNRRPFVSINDGSFALIDTGSSFGLALNEAAARKLGIAPGPGRQREGARDVASGTINARRIAAATVYIGSLELRRVPTDVLSGVAAGSPILLGREALRPFRLTFDPLNRLIEIRPGR